MLSAIAASRLTVATPPPGADAPAPTSDTALTEQGPLSVNVALVVDTLPESAQAKATAELEQQLTVLAGEHGLVLVEREAAVLFIRLELTQPDRNEDVFLVDVAAVYGDEVLPRQSAQACVQCTPAEMVQDGIGLFKTALTQVEERRAEAAAAAAQAQADEAEDPQPAPPPKVSARKLGAAGYVGVSSIVLGVGSTIAGAVLLGRGQVDPTGLHIEYIDYRPPGKALVGAGLGMMVVGNILLAVDLTVLEQRRRSAARARIDSVSLTTMHGPGIVVTGRF